jgi:exopolysaccharide biosynthesis WecB/TagA/CpsF family protein
VSTLHGITFSSLTEEGVVDTVMRRISAGQGGRVITPNVDILSQALADPALRELVRSAEIVCADGMPILWASRLSGAPLPARVAGSALGPLLARRAAEKGIGLFLLGGNVGAGENAAARLMADHPSLRVGYHYPPPGFEQVPVETEAIRVALDRFGPSVCLVGLGFPKQDLLGRDLLGAFPASWFIGAGATIGFLAGEFSRAPLWMQRAGLEWVHRLILEPGRLWRRYLIRDLPFAVRLLAAALTSRFHRPRMSR